MSKKPAIPALLVVPGDAHDFFSLYAIATPYAHSGELLNSHAARINQVTLAFPAMVCSSRSTTPTTPPRRRMTGEGITLKNCGNGLSRTTKT